MFRTIQQPDWQLWHERVAEKLRLVLVGFVVGYGIVMLVLVLLWHSPLRTEQHIWWLELSNIFAPYLFLPVVFLAPLLPMMRSAIFLITLTVLIGLFLILFRASLLPPPPVQRGGMPLRVMTFNFYFAAWWRIEEMTSYIEAQNADIVAMQEVSIPLANAIQWHLQRQYPYQCIDHTNHMALLSRYPLREIQAVQGFPAQRVMVDVGETEVSLIHVHPESPAVETAEIKLLAPVRVIRNYDTTLRSTQVERLVAEVDTMHGPLIVLGDLNTSDREPHYTEFATRLHDAYRETSWGFGFTFPYRKQFGGIPVLVPLVRVDYVWSRAGIVPQSAHVTCHPRWSDHCMVVADLAIER